MMKIILLEDVKKQGKKGEIIIVADGYGNFLIKDHKAVLASSGSVTRLNNEKEQAKKEEEALIKECEKIKNKLEKEKFIFKVKTGKDDKVFGSISPKQIESELKNKKYNIDKKQIHINEPLSSLGVHNVQIELHKKVSAIIKIEVSK